MKKSLLFLGLVIFVSSTAIAAPENVQIIDSFKGGLNIDLINQCNEKVESLCNQDDQSIMQYMQCTKKTMQDLDYCQQNLAFLNATSGYFENIKQYDNIAVINAMVIAADHSEAYFIVDSQGELVSPTDALDLKQADNYAQIAAKFNRVMLWPIPYTFPSVKKLDDGGQRVVFQQLLLNGCHACEQAGIAKVAYDFSPDGHYTGISLLELIPANPQESWGQG